MMRIFSVLALGLILIAGPARADSCPQQGVVQSAAQAFQSAARQGTSQAFVNAAARYTDLNGLALFALGQYRSSLKPGQQAKYISLARSFMGKFMADNANHIPNSPVSIVACNGNNVTAKFDSGGTIGFKLAGGGKIADVTIAGISVAGAMRSKFTGVIANNNGDVDSLLTYLAR